MKTNLFKSKLFFFLALLIMVSTANAQDKQVGVIQCYQIMTQADSLVNAKKFKEANVKYTYAFNMLGWKVPNGYFFNAACAWSMLGNADSAFANLNRITRKGKYMAPAYVVADSDLMALHTDKRWQPLIDIYTKNKQETEAKLNVALVHELDTVRTDDQKYRQRMMELIQSGVKMDSAWISKNQSFIIGMKGMKAQDSIDLVKVEAIINKYGWLGTDVVGEEGNTTLFLVIQHSGLKVQEKYLPMMKEAAKNGKADPADLALLEDRVEMYNGRPQIYGSQLKAGTDGKYFIYTIIDEKNIDKRRAEVGLMPLEEYAKQFGVDYKLPTN